MNEINQELGFNTALCERVKRLRLNKGWTAEQMAIALGIPADRYRKYETRTPIPHYLIPKLSLITERSIEWLLTGHDRDRRAVVERRFQADPPLSS